ncbi:MAG TPA: hypothetical protein VKY92_21135, partial [Verrucomicrobiae bacterium]|nr:hypothetical protein [Verrucomicrobiae bacterium]
PSLRDSISSATEPKVKTLGYGHPSLSGRDGPEVKRASTAGSIEMFYKAMLRSHLLALVMAVRQFCRANGAQRWAKGVKQ